MKIDAAGLATVVLESQAEVDHHDPPLAEDHVRCREVAVDDAGPMEAADDTPDLPRGLHRKGPTAVQDLLHRPTFDEFHDDQGRSKIDVGYDRQRHARVPGFRTQ